MNFLPFEGDVAPGADQRPRRRRRGRRARPARGRAAAGSSSASGPSTSASTTPRPTAARVSATEYLGTTQIVTLDTAARRGQGARRLRPSRSRSATTTGLAFDARTLTVFEAAQRPRARAPPPTRGCSAMAEVVARRASPRPSAPATALDGVTLTVPDGAFVVLLGPTGAGKTTTLRLISGLDRPDRGDGPDRRPPDDRPARPAQRNVAMVFQQYSLYPHMTVRENLAFPLRSPILAHAARRDRAQGPRGRRGPADRPQARQQGDRALRRRDAARLDRPGAGPRPVDLPDGRAARARSTPSSAPTSASSSSASRRTPARRFSTSPTTRSRR